MATGDNLKNTKAIVAAVLGFVAPGAAYLAGVSSDGVSQQEWITAVLVCIGGGVVLGGVVQRVENKPKDAAGTNGINVESSGDRGRLEH